MSNFIRQIKFELAYLLGNAPWDSGITPPELYDFIATHPAGRALDIGCGTGTNVVTLANAGWSVTGFDFSPGAIRSAKRKARNAKIKAELFTDDATKMKHVNSAFDLALDLGCFHGIENKADYLTQLTRVLAPGGFWLLYGFFKSPPHFSGRFDRLSAAPGLVDSDLDLIQRHNLTLVSRKDGWDKRERPSAWFLWQAK
jgi:SAM-dependent methyltransferase